MIKKLIPALALLLAGCDTVSRHVTNQEVIAEKFKVRDLRDVFTVPGLEQQFVVRDGRGDVHFVTMAMGGVLEDKLIIPAVRPPVDLLDTAALPPAKTAGKR